MADNTQRWTRDYLFDILGQLDVAHESTGLLKSTTEEGAPDNVPVVP